MATVLVTKFVSLPTPPRRILLLSTQKFVFAPKQKHKNNQKCVDIFRIFAILSSSPLMAQQLQPLENKHHVTNHRKKQS